ncbi:hypothetical protein CsSME_00048096 [Camellia sinensis var. sinensis]
MAMTLCNSCNPLVPSSTILLCSLFFSTLYYFPLRATALSFNFTDIGRYVNGEIILEGDAYITPEGIQVTPNEHSNPLHLWDKDSGKLADFNTYFLFVIDLEGNSSFADGLAFFLVPYGSAPNMILGGSLGLPNVAQSSNVTNHFVAVEFDTHHNPQYDVLNETHVRIDINSLISNATQVRYNNITFGIENEAWISYNSSSKNFSVVFTGSKNNTALSLQVDLRKYLPDWVTIGISTATGNCFEKNTIRSWQFNSSLQIPTKNQKKPPVMGLIVSSSVLICGKRRRFAIELCMDNDFEAGTGSKKFSYGDLFRATNKFAKGNKLGEGGFREVYRGFLKKSNSYVAVKRISKGSKQGTKEYTPEVKIISRLRHRNLVQLTGWCHEKRELLLVYDLMENGSLDYHRFKEKSLLTWALRYKIAKHLASALLYLHEEWEKCFWSCGVEIACGRKPIDFKVPERQMILVELVWELYGNDRFLEATVDLKMCPDFVQEEIECLMIVERWCAHPDHNLRPSIGQAINVLNFETLFSQQKCLWQHTLLLQ